MFKPKKSLGQNFLIDKNILKKIIKHADIHDNNVIEIGPGSGNLTSEIISQNPKSLTLIEKDKNLFTNLKNKLCKKKNINIINKDILDTDLEKLVKSETVIIGNLPYNISSQILAKLIKFKKWPPNYKQLILMFQKEVAERINAKIGSTKYGRISLLASSRLSVKNSFDVSPNCFYPKPKVNSSVLIMEPIINNNFQVKNIENLEKISHKFFSKKRKKINKVFKELFKNPFEVSRKLKINLDLRPSQLSEIEYFKITKYFEDCI